VSQTEPIGRGSSTDCVVHVVEQSYDAEAEYDHERNGDDDEDDPPPSTDMRSSSCNADRHLQWMSALSRVGCQPQS